MCAQYEFSEAIPDSCRRLVISKSERLVFALVLLFDSTLFGYSYHRTVPSATICCGEILGSAGVADNTVGGGPPSGTGVQ